MNLFRSLKVDEREMYIWFVVPACALKGCLFGMQVSLSLTHSVQQWVLRKWRLDVEHTHAGIDLQNDLPKLLDLPFADEYFFARTAHEAPALFWTVWCKNLKKWVCC